MKGNTTMNISQEQIVSYIRDNIDQCLKFLDADFDFIRRDCIDGSFLIIPTVEAKIRIDYEDLMDYIERKKTDNEE
jgi:hypothetical protein